eukprot:1183520-Prorocentrum_minimum.AAC.2
MIKRCKVCFSNTKNTFMKQSGFPSTLDATTPFTGRVRTIYDSTTRLSVDGSIADHRRQAERLVYQSGSRSNASHNPTWNCG